MTLKQRGNSRVVSSRERLGGTSSLLDVCINAMIGTARFEH